jgi:YbgC/YbaW family acyl-CoA thioester hydrolase
MQPPVPADAPPPPPACFRFFHRLRVRWAECDMQGIVFNPHYLMYFDVAFTEYMRAIGLPYPAAFLADGTDTFMVSMSADFRGSARYDDDIDVWVRTEYFGTTSFRMGFSIRRGDVVLVEGAAVYVNGDKDTHASRPLPQRFIAMVEGFESAAPARKAAAAVELGEQSLPPQTPRL